ncbi:MAG: spore coat protein U domain-containing protein [Rhizobiales bacterium]|nr:spore coat protein U domain-containing protein [Hyphomicrobiales bacterium]
MTRWLAAVFLLALGTTPALAQSCTFTMPNINFGTVDLTTGVNYNTTVNFQASCTGTAGSIVRICPNFNAGSGGVDGTGANRYMLNGVNQLRYNLYRNAAFTTVWGSRIWGLPPIPPTINITLNGAGSGTSTTAVRGRIFSGQPAVPVGSYTSSFAGAQTRVNYAYSTSGTCVAITTANLNPTQTPFTVSAVVGGACIVSATAMSFGTQTLLNANVDATNALSVRCPSAIPYTVGLNGGNAGASNPAARLMSNGANSVTYGIYRDAARSLGWGDTIGVNTEAGTGTGSAQSYTSYGRIAPQATPPAATYTDTIVVTVTY